MVLRCPGREYLLHGYQILGDTPEWLYEPFNKKYSAELLYTAHEAARQLDKLFEQTLRIVGDQPIVPLSGGWDSRLILAALTEHMTNIVTVTLGNPGQLDYEVGTAIAETAGTEHISIRLDEIEVHWHELVRVARRAPWTYMLDAHFIHLGYDRALEKSGSDVIVSGFLGEALTGGHFSRGQECDNQHTAQVRFRKRQQRFPEDWLQHSSPCPQVYPIPPLHENHGISHMDFLDFAVRQRGCIAPIVLGMDWNGWTAQQNRNGRGYRMIAPFADVEWASYWLNAPPWARENQKLYRKMSRARFPELFSLPSKYSWGITPSRRISQRVIRLQQALRNRLHRKFPRLPIRSGLTDNYMDFQKAFRERDDYATVIEKAVSVLKERRATPWLDLDCIWREHYLGKRDHSKGLQVLLSLAVNLDAGN